MFDSVKRLLKYTYKNIYHSCMEATGDRRYCELIALLNTPINIPVRRFDAKYPYPVPGNIVLATLMAGLYTLYFIPVYIMLLLAYPIHPLILLAEFYGVIFMFCYFWIQTYRKTDSMIAGTMALLSMVLLDSLLLYGESVVNAVLFWIKLIITVIVLVFVVDVAYLEYIRAQEINAVKRLEDILFFGEEETTEEENQA